MVFQRDCVYEVVVVVVVVVCVSVMYLCMQVGIYTCIWIHPVLTYGFVNKYTYFALYACLGICINVFTHI